MRWRFFAIDEHFHFTLLGTNDHGLLAHPPHHVERTVRLSSQRQFQHVLLDAALDDLAQFLGDGKEPIGRTQPLQGLVRPLVVVVLYPQPHPLAGGLEAVELCAHQKLLPDRLPEAFDLPQGHRMMGPAFDVVDPILAQLRLEAGGPAPTRGPTALIGEHFFGHTVLRDRRAVYLQHVLRRLAAKHVQPHHVAGVIVDKADEVGVLASQTEGKDIGLPHLVGSGPLEEARFGWIALGLAPRFFEQLLLM